MRARAELLWIAMLATTIGCKMAGSKPDVQLADDIDAIEQALAEREAELTRQGVVVAYRDVAPTVEGAVAGESPVDAETPQDEQEPTATEPPPVEPTTPTTTAPPEPAAPIEADGEGPRLSGQSYEREMVVHERRSKRQRARAAADEESSRCERLWSLADSTCGLSARICGLSSRHPGDIRYAVACRRAEDQCTAARTLCESCPV